MRGIAKKLLSGAVCLAFLLAYAAPAALCGTSCADRAEVMACCGAPSADGASVLASSCCCDIKGGGGEAIPPSALEPNYGPDAPYADPAAGGYAAAGYTAAGPGNASVHSLHETSPIYKQTCSYLC